MSYSVREASSQRFWDAINGKRVDRPPVFPKIWLDWPAKDCGRIKRALEDPETAMLGPVQAAKDLDFDAARLFLMPRRRIRQEGEQLLHIDENGNVLGKVDLLGGWSTRFQDPRHFDLEDPAITMNPERYAPALPPLQSMEDVQRMALPDASWYETMGYGAMVERAKALAGHSAEPIGDCNTGTLSFYIALRGMTEAMTDLIDDPALVHACMEKGIQMALEKARFFLARGIRVLRYNDSAANMKLISPAMWREFIFPHLKDFCAGVHALSPGARVYCHICGDVRPILPDLVASGLDCIAPLDPLGGCTPGEVRRAVGPGFPLMGGVNTLTLLNGSPEDVYRETLSCISAAGAPYIAGSGCAVARDTSGENLRAMVRAAADSAL